MKDYLHKLQKVDQSVEEFLLNSQNSSEIKHITDRFSHSIQPCINEIHQSSARLKSLIDNCLEDLKYAETVWENQPTVLAKPSNETIEEIGRLGGCSLKISEMIKQCKLSMIEKLSSSWKKEFENLNNQWFMSQEGKLKQGIGWNEKDSYITGIKEIKTNQLKQFEQFLDKSFRLIQDKINELSELNKFKTHLKHLDKHAEKKHLQMVVSSLEKVKISLSSGGKFNHSQEHYLQYFETQALTKIDMLTNKPWVEISWQNLTKGELPKTEITWEEVNISSSEYLEQLEIVITEIFEQQSELSKIFLDTLMKFYNDFLEKQKSYQAETEEQKELKQQWLKKQRDELSNLKASLEDI